MGVIGSLQNVMYQSDQVGFGTSSEHPKSALTLLNLYYNSVGRNCLLLLNVPPNSSGLISDEDLQVLQEFTALRHTIFSQNLAQNAIVVASSTCGGPEDPWFGPSNILQEGIHTYWAPDDHQIDWALYVDLGEQVSFNVMQVQEPIRMGQRVIEFHLDVIEDGEWKTVINGTTIGYKRLLLFPMVTCNLLGLLLINLVLILLFHILASTWTHFPLTMTYVMQVAAVLSR